MIGLLAASGTISVNGIRHLVWDTGAGFELDQACDRAALPCWPRPR